MNDELFDGMNDEDYEDHLLNEEMEYEEDIRYREMYENDPFYMGDKEEEEFSQNIIPNSNSGCAGLVFIVLLLSFVSLFI